MYEIAPSKLPMRMPSNTSSTRSPMLRALALRKVNVPCTCRVPIRMARRVVEERVPASAPFTGFAVVERACVGDDRGGSSGNRRNQRPCGIERERRAPRARRIIGPRDGHRIAGRSDSHRPWPQLARVERNRLRRGKGRNESTNARIKLVFSLFMSHQLLSTFHFLLSTFFLPSTPQIASASLRSSSGTPRRSILR